LCLSGDGNDDENGGGGIPQPNLQTPLDCTYQTLFRLNSCQFNVLRCMKFIRVSQLQHNLSISFKYFIRVVFIWKTASTIGIPFLPQLSKLFKRKQPSSSQTHAHTYIHTIPCIYYNRWTNIRWEDREARAELV
jgi:hypothetical protein